MTSTSLCQSRSLPVVPTKIPPWVIRPEHYPPGLEHVPIVQAVQKVQIVQTPSFILPRDALISGRMSPRWTLKLFCGMLLADGHQRGGVRSSFSARGPQAHQCGGARSSRVVAGGSGTQSLHLARLARSQRQGQSGELPGGAGTLAAPWSDRSAAAAPYRAIWRIALCHHPLERACEA